MKFKLNKASDLKFKEEIEINSIAELANFIKNTKSKSIIIDYFEPTVDCLGAKREEFYNITIYDDYVE